METETLSSKDSSKNLEVKDSGSTNHAEDNINDDNTHKSDQKGDDVAASHAGTVGFSRPKIVTLKYDQIKELEEYIYKRETPKREFKPDLSKLVPIDKIYKAYKNIRSTVRRTPLT
jgi:hypothetical protein